MGAAGDGSAASGSSGSRGGRWGDRLVGPAVVLVFLSLSLGPFALELATEAALLAAALWGAREGPLLPPVIAVCLALLASTLSAGLDGGVEALRLCWALALLVALPPLFARPGAAAWRPRAWSWGLGAAALVGCGSVVELAVAWSTGADLSDGGARGPFSHHLTLGYALLPPLAAALHARRFALAAPIALGALASLGLGPALCAALVLVSVVASPAVGLGLGLVATLALIAGLSHLDPSGEVGQRALLWTSGAEVVAAAPGGVGAGEARGALALAQDRLQPGFHFPLHAHDSALQVGVWAGVGGWVAWAWLLVTLWRRTHRAGRAALVGVGVGALTQDTLGDLEVVRALSAWALLPLAPGWGEPAQVPVVDAEHHPVSG